MTDFKTLATQLRDLQDSNKKNVEKLLDKAMGEGFEPTGLRRYVAWKRQDENKRAQREAIDQQCRYLAGERDTPAVLPIGCELHRAVNCFRRQMTVRQVADEMGISTGKAGKLRELAQMFLVHVHESVDAAPPHDPATGVIKETTESCGGGESTNERPDRRAQSELEGRHNGNARILPGEQGEVSSAPSRSPSGAQGGADGDCAREADEDALPSVWRSEEPRAPLLGIREAAGRGVALQEAPRGDAPEEIENLAAAWKCRHARAERRTEPPKGRDVASMPAGQSEIGADRDAQQSTQTVTAGVAPGPQDPIEINPGEGTAGTAKPIGQAVPTEDDDLELPTNLDRRHELRTA